jgi:hypothetical protein
MLLLQPTCSAYLPGVKIWAAGSAALPPVHVAVAVADAVWSASLVFARPVG